MKKRLIFVYCILFSTLILAQGPPITAETPVMLGLSGSGVRTFGKFISKENANIYVQPIGIPYNISSTFQVGGVFPFKFITPNEGETTGGLADITLFTKYQLYKKDAKAKTFRILANIKQSFPTGQTKDMPIIGSGLYQTHIGLIVGRISSAIGVYADAGYVITNKKATDKFVYNFSVGVPLLPQQYPQKQVNIFLACNGSYFLDEKIHELFISPGLQFIPEKRILFETSFQIPVIQHNILVNKTKYMIVLGTRFLIN